MTNRYTNLSFSNLKDVPLLSLPYEALDKLLGSAQQTKQVADAALSIAPKFIQESVYATETAKQLAQYQENIKGTLTDLARKGDSKGYMNALSQAQQEVAKLYRPGGIASNLEQDYNKYVGHVAKEQERLSKGEITPEQYQMSVKKPVQEYDSLKGTKLFNPVLKPQAVNFDKFATDFVKNYEDTDLINQGNFRVINGQLVYDETKISGIQAQRVLTDLTNAYKNAAGATGQLEDRFEVLNSNGQVTFMFRESQSKQISELENSLTKTSTKGEVESLQKKLQALGLDTGGIDGKLGPKTKKAIEDAKGLVEESKNTLSNTEDADLTEGAKKTYIDQYLNSLATPYANSKAKQESTKKFTNFGETMSTFKAKEDYKSKLRKVEEREKEGVFRIEGQSSFFNPSLFPKDAKGLGEAIKGTQESIDVLRQERAGVTDPQRAAKIDSQIAWNEAVLQRQQQMDKLAEESVGSNGFNAWKEKTGFNKFNANEQQNFFNFLKTGDEYGIKSLFRLRTGREVTTEEIKQIGKDYQGFLNQEVVDKDKFLKERGNDLFSLGTISLAPAEKEAIKASLNTDDWTFFDEKGVIDNKEKGTIFGTEKKPIISDNITIGGMTKHPFGQFGNMVTLTDANGKVYYGALKNGNVGEAIGNNIKNKAPQGSQQYMLGAMISNSGAANVLSQMTDLRDGQAVPIVEGSNKLGTIKKDELESGNMLYTLTAPEGMIFANGKNTLEYDNPEQAARDLLIVNETINQNKSK